MMNEYRPLMGPMQLNGAYMNCAMPDFVAMAGCAAEVLCAKWILIGSLTSYATIFFKRYDNMQLTQRSFAAHKGIL